MHPIDRREFVGASTLAGVADLLPRSATALHEASICPAEHPPAPISNGTMIKIDTKPAPLEVDIARTAVIVCDMQNDFGAVGSPIQAAVEPTSRVVFGWVSTSAALATALVTVSGQTKAK